MQQVFDFLRQLSQNNNKDWFHSHKASYEQAKATCAHLFSELQETIQQLDHVQPVKQYRIYNDVRFAKNKPLYKTHFGAIIARTQPYNRGSFYMHIEPGASFVGGGFWGPSNDDLKTIRKAIEAEDTLMTLQAQPEFQALYGAINGDGVKVAPNGFDKTHPRIELIRKKQFLFTHAVTDEELLHNKLQDKIGRLYEAALPFFHYMTDVLITDGNGEYKVFS